MIAGGRSGALQSGSAAATKLGVSIQPGPSVSGSALTIQPVVQGQSPVGTLVSTFVGVVTAAIGSGSGGVLTGTTAVTAVGGIATFTDLVVTGEDTYTLVFTAVPSGLTSATSAGFAVQVPTHLVVTTQPAGAVAGVPFTTQLVAEVRDAANAKVVASVATCAVSVATGSGSLSGTTSKAAVAGVITYTNLQLSTPDTYTLALASAGLTGTTTSSFACASAGTPTAPVYVPGTSTSFWKGDTTTAPYTNGEVLNLTSSVTYKNGETVALNAVRINGVVRNNFTDMIVQADGKGFKSASLVGGNLYNAQITIQSVNSGVVTTGVYWIAWVDAVNNIYYPATSPSGPPVVIGTPGSTANFNYIPTVNVTLAYWKCSQAGTCDTNGGPVGAGTQNDGTAKWVNQGAYQSVDHLSINSTAMLSVASSIALVSGRSGGYASRVIFAKKVPLSDITVDGSNTHVISSPTLTAQFFATAYALSAAGAKLEIITGGNAGTYTYVSYDPVLDKFTMSGAIGARGASGITGKVWPSQQGVNFNSGIYAATPVTTDVMCIDTYRRLTGDKAYFAANGLQLKNNHMAVSPPNGGQEYQTSSAGGVGAPGWPPIAAESFLQFVPAGSLDTNATGTFADLRVDASDNTIVTFEPSSGNLPGGQISITGGAGFSTGTFYPTFAERNIAIGARSPKMYLHSGSPFGPVVSVAAKGSVGGSGTWSGIGTNAYPDVADWATQPVGPWFNDLIDGQWHLWQIRIVSDSGPNLHDGYFELFIDGTLVEWVSLVSLHVTPAGGAKQWTSARPLLNLPMQTYIASVAWSGLMTKPVPNDGDLTDDIDIPSFRIYKE